MHPHGSSHRSQRRCLRTCTLTSGRTSSPYLPLSIVLTLVYVKSGKNVAYSWLFHALNNTIMVILMFAMQGALQNA